MAEFVAPQFQNPDFLRQAALGNALGTQQALAPGAYQGQQQELTEGGLRIDQLRQTIAQQGLVQQFSRNLAGQPNGGQPTQTGQAMGGGAGTQGDASQSPYGNVNTLMALDVLQGRDPLKSAEAAQNYQQQQKKLQVAGPMNLAETVANDPNADQIIRNNPSLQQQWVALAPKLGLDPYKDLTAENARKVAAFGYNQLGASAGLPAKDFGFTGDLKPGEAHYVNGRLVAGDPNGMTPYQVQQLGIERSRLGSENSHRAFEENQSKIPNGYEVDPTKQDGSIRPIAGGPHDPNASGGGLDGRSTQQFQRVVNAGNSAAESIKNIMELPMGASTGMFGGYHPGTSIFGSTMGVLKQKVTPQAAQDYNVMMTGLSRNLATLETSGLAPPGSLTHSIDAIAIGPGDSNMTILRKNAEVRQIVTTNLEPQLSNPRLSPSQRQIVQSIVDKVSAAVPYTNHDITKLQNSTDPKATIMDFAKKQDVGNANHPPEITSLLDKYK
jgi:hypothetical protein